MKNARPHTSEASARNSADCTKPLNPLRTVFAAPLAVDLLLLAVAAALLIGGAA